MIRWLAMTGRLPGNAEALIERIMDEPHDASGHRQPPETRSRSIVTWEVMRSVWREEEGLEGMGLPGEWRETFEAGAHLRRLFGAMPPETVALWIAERGAREKEGATDEEVRRLDDSYAVPYGITVELEERAVGPDRGEISEAEKKWPIEEHVHDVLASPWGWEFHKHTSKAETRR
jgi:hypothetical protein